MKNEERAKWPILVMLSVTLASCGKPERSSGSEVKSDGDEKTEKRARGFGVRLIHPNKGTFGKMISEGKRVAALTAGDLRGHWRLLETSYDALLFREMLIESDGRVIFFDILEDGGQLIPEMWESTLEYTETSSSLRMGSKDFRIRALRIGKGLLVELSYRNDKDEESIQVFQIERRAR